MSIKFKHLLIVEDWIEFLGSSDEVLVDESEQGDVELPVSEFLAESPHCLIITFDSLWVKPPLQLAVDDPFLGLLVYLQQYQHQHVIQGNTVCFGFELALDSGDSASEQPIEHLACGLAGIYLVTHPLD